MTGARRPQPVRAHRLPMPYLQLNDEQHPLRDGETRVGTGAGADVRLPAAAGAPEASAIVRVDDGEMVSIRRGAVGGSVRVNGVQLGPEPTPLMHGDRVEIGAHELRFGDDRQDGSTRSMPSVTLADLAPRSGDASAPPAATFGGRLVSLVDGREYPISKSGIRIGRDASCDVVVAATDVSRRHAEITTGAGGYTLCDTSANGVLINGERVVRTRLLSRGDVVRIGGEEFRFHADVPPPAATRGADGNGVVAGNGAGAAGAGITLVDRPVLATLEIINEGLLKGRRYDLRSPLSHVGRGAHNDVAIADDSVSDTHAKLQRRDGGWYVIDLGSTNGTYVGGRRLDAEAPLAGSPDVRFGGVKMIFRPAEDIVYTPRGTRAIAAADVERARRIALAAQSRTPSPPWGAPAARTSPGRRGIPAWLWIAVIAVVCAAAFLILLGR